MILFFELTKMGFLLFFQLTIVVDDEGKRVAIRFTQDAIFSIRSSRTTSCLPCAFTPLYLIKLLAK